MAIRFQLYRAYADDPRASSSPRTRKSVKASSDSLAFSYAIYERCDLAIVRRELYEYFLRASFPAKFAERANLDTRITLFLLIDGKNKESIKLNK